MFQEWFKRYEEIKRKKDIRVIGFRKKQQRYLETKREERDRLRIEHLKLENEKKDKIIDEMAKQMSAICTGISIVREQFEKCYCEFINTDEDCCWKTDKECKDCIKQYFERKVK